ncbi:HAD family hydrolase [Nocardioides jensenii]|uniref:HAD family hydrolase n=1 Tax=Nocardioides jensenii TaxID=1843 RepID=UPI0008331DCE|nr:HAD family phosphatase [Nocardioides jensenii]
MTGRTGRRRPSLVIFDCDGVLVDTERIIQEIDLRMIAELGWPITLAEIHEHHLGRSTEEMVASVERHIGRPIPSDWMEDRRRAYREACAERLAPVPGIVPVVEQLLAAGQPVCVASSGSHAAIRFSLGHTGLLDTFAGRIFSAHDVGRGKPAPDLFLHAARTMGADPSACVVVEDSPAGVAAARAAGIPVVAYAERTPAHLLRGADEVITDMAHLLPSFRRVATG